jgi:tetratricopeptide (TPR) repeat protein
MKGIGAILEDFGQYDRAIEMHLQALEIDKALNGLDGVASDYGNLGVTYHLKGDHERTVSWLKRSLELFTKIGATDKAAQVQKLLTEITSDSNAEGG